MEKFSIIVASPNEQRCRRFVRKTYEIIGNSPFTKSVVILIALLGFTWLAYKLFDRIISLFDHSQKSLKKLTDLSDRLSSSISESDGNIPNLSNSFLNITQAPLHVVLVSEINCRD